MKVINLEDAKTSKIKYVVDSVFLGENIHHKPEYRVLIMLKNIENNRVIFSPLTETLDYWPRASYSTLVKYATYITVFLNYILFKNFKIFNIKALANITFEHGSDFLNSLYNKGNSRSSIKEYEDVLIGFYYFLAKLNIFNNISIKDFEVKKVPYNERSCRDYYIVSPFKNIKYYSMKYKGKGILHNLPNELIFPFLETAIIETPQIAFGVYLQFFGGLRVGDCINTTHYSITKIGAFGLQGMIINIRKRNLRPDLKNKSGKGGVKKERFQYIMPYHDLLANLYKLHLTKFKPSDNSDAVFVDRNGNAMTQENYRAIFTRLRNKFISKLRNSGDTRLQAYAEYLKGTKWNSHIGRGIFSNLVSNVARNTLEVAVLRGDSTLEAALTYVTDSDRIRMLCEQNLDKMYSVERINGIIKENKY